MNTYCAFLCALMLLLPNVVDAAPIISNVSVSDISPTSAKISWITDIPANSQVDYGVDAYENGPAFGGTGFGTSHSVPLSNLLPSTVYHFRVISKDAIGDIAQSSDSTFTTLAPDPNAAFDYHFSIYQSPRNVVRGYAIYLTFRLKLLAGTGGVTVSVTLLNPPPGATYGFGQFINPPTAQTGSIYVAQGGGETDVLTIFTSSSTPVGTYSITLRATGGNVTKDISYPITVVAVPSSITTAAPLSLPPIPGLSVWEEKMVSLGTKWCNRDQILAEGLWEGSVWYYDGERVYYQIADYTQNAFWDQCAHYVEEVYRPYVLTNNGAIPGWRVFPDGLLKDFRNTGDLPSKDALLALANNSPYSQSAGRTSIERSRETAFIVNAYLDAYAVGEPANPRLLRGVSYALGHLDQWTVAQTAAYVRAYMIGLTMEALIRYYEQSADPRIPDAIKKALDWLWSNVFDSSTSAFFYTDRDTWHGGRTPYPELNLLIAPAFAWYYRITGNSIYLQRGDLLFEAGVKSQISLSGKMFSQNYRWSFDYVRYRTP